jgi:FHS family Na+ dependent glucose MFS transporter 1
LYLRGFTTSTVPTIEEGSGRRSQTTGYFAAFVALGLTIASFGPTLPSLAAQVHTRLSEISFLFMARSLGYLLGSLRVGRLYDRAPGHPLMAIVLVVMSLMMMLVPLLPSLWLLTLVLLVLGAAEGTLDVGGNVLLVRVYGKGVAPFMNGLHFFFGLGAFLAPVIVAQSFLFHQGIKLSYWIIACLLLPVAVWLFRTPGPVLYAEAGSRATGRADDRLIALIALFMFLYGGAEMSFGGWIYTYTLRMNLSGETAAAYLTSAFWGALTFGRLLSIPLAARFRPRSILFCDLIGCLLSVGVILLWPGSFLANTIGTIGLGLAMASIFPTTLTFAERRMAITGRVTGWFIVGASAGSMSLPWLIGQLFERTGARITMIVIISALIAALGVLAVLIRSSKHEDGEIN